MAEAEAPRGARRPRLAVIVANAITGDSRVQKSALAAAHAGWDVTLVGRTQAPVPGYSWLGPVKVVRVPVGRSMRRAERLRRERPARSRLTQLGLRSVPELEVYEARSRLRSSRRGQLADRVDQRAPAPLGRAVRGGVRALERADAGLTSLRVRAFWWEQRHRPDDQLAVGDWARDWPMLLDLELAFVPVLADLAPDVIHANDITTLNTAAAAAGLLRSRGHRVSWVYDAHEYVAGVDWPYPRMMSAYPQLERELIHRADAVITVSDKIAEVIQREHGLATTPLVVQNTPVRAAVGTTSASVRRTVGLADDVPLLVYSGYIHHERSVGTAVAALPELPGVHLAVVCGQDNAELRAILGLADELGVADRVHPAPYVAQHEVPDYLSSADAGIICSKRTINYELSLPTKAAEYLHAGLPIVASDLQTLSEFVREQGVGEVFDPEAPGSFAAAARRVLADREGYTGRISAEVLEQLSWEHQVGKQLALYAELHGAAPQAPRAAGGWEVRERPRSTPGREHAGPGWRPLDQDTPVRLGLGPANFAGQLGALARAVTTRRDDVSAEVFVRDGGSPFQYPADVLVPDRHLKQLEGQVEQLWRILPRYTHLLADAFKPVLGHLNGDDVSGDLPALRAHEIRTALLSHGTDSRHPGRHQERVPWSLFLGDPDGQNRRRTAKVERNHRTAAESGLPLFVTTPDLLDDLPGATWLPLIVDVDAWACDRPVLERARPVVLHAPSKRWTKGTDLFAPALQALHDRGLIDFQVVEGLPWAQMRERVLAADVVVDQVAIGSYGAFACEAMAAGKPVVAWLSETVEAALPDHPVLNATPDQVGARIEQLLDDRDAAREIGRRSVDFARRTHDGALSATVLEEFLTLG